MSPVAGQLVTFPDTVFTITWYDFPGSKSLNSNDLSSILFLVAGASLLDAKDTWYLSNSEVPLGGSQKTRNDVGVSDPLSNVTFRGLNGTVLYCAVVGADVS